jgi:hypothetical protein
MVKAIAKISDSNSPENVQNLLTIEITEPIEPLQRHTSMLTRENLHP